MKTPRARTVTHILLITLFCGLITLPLLGTFFHWDFYPYQGENRKLAELPDCRRLSLAELPAACDAYCNDHFGFRNTFLRHYTRLTKKYLKGGKKEMALGRDGWMFLDKTIRDYMGLYKLPEPAAKELAGALVARKDLLARNGIPYLLVIAPDKIKIYPDKKPELQLNTNAITRMDQLRAGLPDSFQTNLLYLRDALKAARTEKQVYYVNDTHWTDYGAYVGYREIIRELQAWRPDLTPVSLEDFNTVVTNYSGDLVTMNGGGKAFPVERLIRKPHPEISVTDYPVGPAKSWHSWPANVNPPQLFTNPQGRGRVLVFHDSFGEPLKDLLPLNFGQTAFFWIYSSPEALDDLIAGFHPDLVIEIHIERRIDLFLDAPVGDHH